MKKLIYLIITAACIITMQACEFETSSHGNLYGYWHLCTIDTIGASTHDMSQKMAFWAVQANVIEVTDRDYIYPQVVFSFKKVNDSLMMFKPLIKDRYSQDPPVEDVSQLLFYGIDNLEPDFCIEKLTSDKMTLSNSKVRLNFKKL